MSSTQPLGHLLWFRVTKAELNLADAEPILKQDGLMPDLPVPIDVFRRVTGQSSTGRYTLRTFDLELTLVVAKAPTDKMLVRHLVGTVVDGAGVAQMSRKVAEVVFYKPPRGNRSKARMRVTLTGVQPQEWKPSVEAHIAGLRKRYEDGIAGTLDNQAIRRIVRAGLGSAKALYLDGPYFVLDTERLDPLRRLFDLLGEDSFMHCVPLVDEDENRALLTRGIERAVASGVEVDENIWKRLEGTS